MRKNLKGYLTVEASLIMPIVLFLYLLIILAALFLYCRCAISQDNFLLGMRGAGFSWGEDSYGEVIYGEREKENWGSDEYVEQRLRYKRKFYPFFPSEGGRYSEEGESVLVTTGQKGLARPVEKRVQRCNPVTIIREGRGK